MVKGKKATKKDDDSELKMVYTHGKKRNAIANAVVKEGNGTITINRIPIQNIEPKTLRIKIFEPILILGIEKFKNLNIKVRVSGGGSVAQLYAARTAIAKGIVPGIKNMQMKNLKMKQEEIYLIMIKIYWLLIIEDQNLKNMEVLVPDQENKNHIVKKNKKNLYYWSKY